MTALFPTPAGRRWATCLALALLAAVITIPAATAYAGGPAAIDIDVRGRKTSKRAERRVGRAVAAAAKKHGYRIAGRGQVTITVILSRSRRRWEARVRVSRGKKTIGHARIRARSEGALAKKIEARLWRSVGGDIKRAVARGEHAPPDEIEAASAETRTDEGNAAGASTKEAGEKTATRDDSSPASPATVDAEAAADTNADGSGDDADAGDKATEDSGIDLAVTAGLQVFSRNLTYTDDLFSALREYKLSAAPAFVIRAELYPMAAVTSGALTRLGVAAMLARSPELSARTPEGAEVGSEARAYAVGLRYRQPLGHAEVIAAADFGARRFAIDDAAARTNAGIPDTDYRYLRVGGRAAVPLFGHLNAGAGAGYRLVLDTGEIGDDRHFSRLSAGGVDATLFLGYAVTDLVNLELGTRVERYFYSMNPEPGDAMVAGGAIDQYLAAFFRLRYTP